MLIPLCIVTEMYGNQLLPTTSRHHCTLYELSRELILCAKRLPFRYLRSQWCLFFVTASMQQIQLFYVYIYFFGVRPTVNCVVVHLYHCKKCMVKMTRTAVTAVSGFIEQVGSMIQNTISIRSTPTSSFKELTEKLVCYPRYTSSYASICWLLFCAG